MADDSSKGAVLLALLGNSFLTVIKFVAFALSGSGAMLSEAIHTLADVGNQALLFVGISRSAKPANAMFHYGFGAERFFFALLSAVGIFILGCGVTVYHGLHTLLHPSRSEYGWLTFVVLGTSFLVDGWVMWKAIRAVNRQKGEIGFFAYLKSSGDPTIAAVLFEDGAACLGVLIALAGILLSIATRSPLPDSIATILIGLMLGLIALWLGYKNRTLILGRAIPREVQEAAVAFLREQPTIETVTAVQSRIVGAGVYKLKAEIDWNGRVLGERQKEWLETREKSGDLATEFGERITEAVAAEVDRIEKALRERFPELIYLDIESD